MTFSHRAIRTYDFSESATGPSEFALKHIDEIYRKSNGAPDLPHRHDYYTILFIEKGAGTHYVDFMEYRIEDRSMYFIFPGQMHQILFSSEPKGAVITFTEHFLLANSITDKMLSDIYLFSEYGQSPPLSIHERDMPVYTALVAQMFHFSQSLDKYVSDAVGALIKLLLIQSNNHCTLRQSDNPQFVETSNQLLINFKQLLRKRYAQTHMVSDYAGDLAVTADYLNKTVKALTGRSAKDHIQSKLVTEAKRALLFTEVSSKELAYELGFDESAHFINFFKKITGQTPSEFRTFARQA